MQYIFKKATKKQARLRMALVGTSGSGKTYSALKIAKGLVGPEGRVAVIDTERGSASKYADAFDFDCLELNVYKLEYYIKAIKIAEQAGYDVLIIDSLSHAWEGFGGALDVVDGASHGMGRFKAWAKVTPLQRRLMDSITGSSMHVITTMRSKTLWIIEESEVDGKRTSRPKKIGTKAIQREGIEYEFDIVGQLDMEHNMHIEKSRFHLLADKNISNPCEKVGAQLRDWLTDGVKPAIQPESPVFDRITFELRLSEIGWDYSSAVELCKKYKRPEPSDMTEEQQEKLLNYLSTLNAPTTSKNQHNVA